MQKAVGETITLVRTNPATGAETRERARVLAANGGVVLQIGERIEVLRDDGLPVRVIFDRVPENLRARPTLSVTRRRAQRGGPPAGDPHLSDPGPRLEGRLCRLVRRGGRADGRPGLDHAHQQQRHAPIVNADTLLVAGAVGQASDGAIAAAASRRRRAAAPGRHRERGPRAARRFLSLSAARADHDRQPPDQAGQLPRRHGDAGRARLRISQRLARHRRPSRRAPTPCCASRARASRASATRCRPAPSASISATRAAIRNSSARARSATRRWARSSASPPARRSTSRSSPCRRRTDHRAKWRDRPLPDLTDGAVDAAREPRSGILADRCATR